MEASGHHVAITGGSRGIGLALARKFLAEGNEVLLIARDTERLAQVAIGEPRFHTFAADLARTGDIARIADFVETQFAGLNVLVNNAGVHHMGDLADGVSAEQMSREIAVNVAAPVLLTQKLLPVLRRNGGGAVVNTASGLGIVPKESAPVYSASKAFIRMFSVVLGYQLEDSGIRVFDFIPPMVDTDMMAGRKVAKMAPAELADRFWSYWLRDKTDMAIGKSRLLKALNRLSPGLARRIMRRL